MFAGCLDVSGEGAKTLLAEVSPKLELVQLDVTKEGQIEAAKAQIVESLVAKYSECHSEIM